MSDPTAGQQPDGRPQGQPGAGGPPAPGGEDDRPTASMAPVGRGSGARQGASTTQAAGPGSPAQDGSGPAPSGQNGRPGNSAGGSRTSGPQPTASGWTPPPLPGRQTPQPPAGGNGTGSGQGRAGRPGAGAGGSNAENQARQASRPGPQGPASPNGGQRPGQPGSQQGRPSGQGSPQARPGPVGSAPGAKPSTKPSPGSGGATAGAAAAGAAGAAGVAAAASTTSPSSAAAPSSGAAGAKPAGSFWSKITDALGIEKSGGKNTAGPQGRVADGSASPGDAQDSAVTTPATTPAPPQPFRTIGGGGSPASRSGSGGRPSGQPGAGAATAVLPAAGAAASPDTKGGETLSAGPPPKPSGVRRTRKARLRLSRLDPWSVMKTSFLFSIAAGIMLVVAVYAVWTVLSTSGLFTSLNEIIASVVSTPGDTTPFRVEDYLNTQRIMGVTALIACIDVAIFTALATLGSFLYNLAATMLGGLEVTLAED